MRTDKVGRVVLDTNDCIELLYNDNFKDNIIVDLDSDVDLYNKYTYIMNTGHSVLEQITEINSIEEFDKLNQDNWFMPEEYKNLNIEGNFFKKKFNQNIDIINYNWSNARFKEKYFEKIKKSKKIALILNCPFIQFNGKNGKVISASVY